MTPILLSDPDTKLGFLADAIKCEVTEERNGSFELALEYPVAGQYFSDISAGRYIKAKPNDTSDPQFFKIYSVSKPINGTITVNAEHISYALSHYPIKKLDTQKTTALVAIQRVLSAANANLKESHKFSVISSDIATLTNFGAEMCSARAALGGIEGSVLDRYGGEYEFDNYNIKLHKNRGKNNGVSIRYGKNMTDMKLLVSTENSYTGIFPYVYDDDKLITLTDGTVHVINNSGIEERILLMDFSSYFENGEEKNETNLKAHVDKYLEDNDINAVDGSMTVSMIDLSKSANAEFAALETVSLCDTVKVVNTLMDVTLSMKVIKTVYDSISEQYKSLELGTPSGSFADVIKQTSRTANKALEKATEVSGLEQVFQSELDNVTKAITGASGGHVILNPSKNPQELLILIDSDNIETATKLYRFNAAGLAYSSNGYDGPYSAGFLGADGKLVINNVTARSISADLIRSGTIMSEDGNMMINLQNSYISSKDGNFKCRINSGNFSLYYASDNMCSIGQAFDQDLSDIYTDKITGYGMWINVEATDDVNPFMKIDLSEGSSTTTNSRFEKTRTDFYVPVTIGANKPKTDWTGFRVYRKSSSNITYNVTYGVGFSGTTPTIAIEQKDADGSIRARLNVKGTVGSSAGELWLNNSLGGTAVESKKLGFGTSELTWGGSTVVVSSIAENKSNIQEAPSVLSLFSKNESKIYSYNFIGANNNISENETSEISTASVDQSNDGSADRNDSYGFVIGDGYNTPKEVLSSDEKHISLYSMAAITWKAVQELIEKNSRLEAKISEIETLIA